MRCLVIGSLLAFLLLPVPAQTTWYVEGNGTATGSGTLADPFGSIQQAIDAATNLDRISVLPGLYLESIDFSGKNVIVESVEGPQTTIIDGRMMERVVRIAQGEGPRAALRGFTIRNGRVGLDSGGGVLILQASPCIENNVIVDNVSEESGGGLAAIVSSAVIQNNVFARNSVVRTSGERGAAVFLASSPPGAPIRFVGNVVRDHVVDDDGGGMYLRNVDGVQIHRNRFINNSAADYGGAIHVSNTDAPEFVGNLFVRNSAVHGGALDPSTRAPRIHGNTFVDNIASEGAAVLYGNTGELVGNILVGTSAVPQIHCYSNYDPARVRNNLGFQPGTIYGGACLDLTGINGNIMADPLFVDAFSDDYRLQALSPCIDAGSTIDPLRTIVDLDRGQRFLDGDLDGAVTVDIGCLEFNNIRLESGVAVPGSTLTLELTSETLTAASILAIGVREHSVYCHPYGLFSVSVAEPHIFLPGGSPPFMWSLTIPMSYAGLEFVAQAAVIDASKGVGNISAHLIINVE